MAEKSVNTTAKEPNQESTITLRPINLSDLDDFMVWAADNRVTQYCIWDTYTSRDQALEFINQFAIPHPWYRVICIDDHAVGSISVTPNSGQDRFRAELGYVLAFDHWGKGICTEAVKMAASTVFNEWPYLKRLEAFVDVDNKGSQKVLEKAGFVKESVLNEYKVVKGKTRDRVVFSLMSQ